ncbi:MFS transporter [Candidatus Woesearchaeota archaeon]|nr:MFS transporter [Candidatus Woesearchaeota archaeon]
MTIIDRTEKKDKLRKKDLNPFTDVKEMLSYPKLRKLAFIGALANITTPLMILVIPFVIIEKMGLTNAQLSVAVFMMGAAHILQLFAGQVADKIGKRRTIAIGLTISSIGLFGLFLAPTYEIILVALFVKAVGGSLFNISMWSYMSDIAEANNIEGKVVGSYSSISRITITISFALGGFLLGILGVKIFLLYGFFIFLPVIIFSKMLFGKRMPLKKTPEEN